MRRRQVSMLVTVSIPAGCDAAWARREVRTLVNEQCGFCSDPGEVKIQRIRAA